MHLLKNQLLINVSRFSLAVAVVTSTLAGQSDAQVNFQLTDQAPTQANARTAINPMAKQTTEAMHHYALDQSGSLIGQVIVTGDMPNGLGVYAMQNNQIVHQAKTNSLGEFTLATIKPGRYSIVIAGRNQLAAQGIMIQQDATETTKDFVQLSTIQTSYKGVQDLVATALPKQISANLGAAVGSMQQVSATLSDIPVAQQVRIINGNIQGQIVSLINENNIAGTTVHLLQNSKPVAQVEIDSKGMFNIPDAEAGIYDLVATADTGMAAMRIEAIANDNPMKMVSFAQPIAIQLSVPLAEDCPCNQAQTVVQTEPPVAMEAASQSPVEYASESIGCGGSCGGCCGATGNFGNASSRVLGSRGGGGGFLGGSGGGLAGASNISRLLTLASLGGAVVAIADDDDAPASNASN